MSTVTITEPVEDSYSGAMVRRSSVAGRIEVYWRGVETADDDAVRMFVAIEQWLDYVPPVSNAFGWSLGLHRGFGKSNRITIAIKPLWNRASCPLGLIELTRFHGRWEAELQQSNTFDKDTYAAICAHFNMEHQEGHHAWRYPTVNATHKAPDWLPEF